MIFDIKIGGDFTRKAILVTSGYKNFPLSSITLLIVVSRDIIGIAFLISSLNYLEIFACNIGNAYLNAKCHENLWTEAGTVF